MRRILLLTALFAAACGPGREDVEVDWTFGGRACDAAGVATIQVDIAGEVLTPNQFTCAEASLGADLGTYLVADYQLTVSGLDAGGAILYQITQTLPVRAGKNVFKVDAAPNQVMLHWTFGSQSCAAAGIKVVHASVDNQVLVGSNNSADLPCSQGGSDGTTVGPLSAGAHSFDLVGFDSAGHARYALNGFSVTALAGQDVVATPDLALVSSASLTWTFDSKTCAAAGVMQVQIFVDPNPDGTGGADAGTVPCDTNNTDGALVERLFPGMHSFAILGINNSTILYRTHHPPSAQFVAGLTTPVSVSAESPP